MARPRKGQPEGMRRPGEGEASPKGEPPAGTPSEPVHQGLGTAWGCVAEGGSRSRSRGSGKRSREAGSEKSGGHSTKATWP